jgi:RHS repeat-associated protein
MRRVLPFLVALAIVSAAVALGFFPFRGHTAPEAPLDVPLAELSWQFEQDDDGRLTALIDPAGKATRLRYERDDHQRVQKAIKELADGTQVQFEFDPLGRRVGMRDALGTVKYDYDGFGRPKAVRRAGAPAVEYAYDTDGRVTALTVGEQTVRYVRDFLGRLERMETPAGPVNYAYFPAQGRTVRTLPNGVATLWQYGPDGRLQFIEHGGPDKLVLVRFEYFYRADGLVSGVKERSRQGERVVAYQYDREKRLSVAEETQPDGTKLRHEYGYDPYGNRTEVAVNGRKVTSRFNWAGQLVEHAGRPCRHDAAGNLLKYHREDGGVSLTYTATNQLAAADTSKGKVGYEYDGEGNLIGRTAEGRKTVFVPDPSSDVWRPLLAGEADGKKALILWDGDTPLGIIESGEMRFFLHDHLGTVRCEVDRQGQAVGWSDCDPFGVPRSEPAAGGLRPGFAGLFYDPVVGVYLTRARVYDPALGRFAQIDPQHHVPIGSQKQLSPYVYCGADPVNYTDNDGAEPRRWRDDMPPVVGPYSRVREQWDQWQQGRIQDNAWRTQIYMGKVLAYQSPPGGLWTDFFSTIPKVRDPGPDFTGGVAAVGGFLLADWAIRQSLPRVDPLGDGGWNSLRTLGDQEYRLKQELNTSNWVENRREQQWQNPSGPLRSYLDNLTKNAAPDVEKDYRRQWKQLPPGGGGSGGTGSGFGGFSGHRGGPFGTSPMSPDKVGGVALRGAGDALKNLGPLRGIALDANGRLVLLARDKGDLELPPLRLDDVVTVFTNVYRHGEAPFVSIDPDPVQPKGDVMHVRHGPAIDASYVAWVLFEADRVMKCYSVGFDNESGQEWKSAIAGYKDSNLFAVPIKRGGKDELWERFWIVPANVTRKQDRSGKLALLDVGLELRTEAMVMCDGKLVPAPDGQSSEAAKKFTSWFTDHYADLEKEAMSTPPAGSGLTGPVPIFAELRRLALIVAVAEALRDQGVPLPRWMREHQVQPFPVPKTTRGRTFRVPGKGAVYGGVTLGASKAGVQTVADSSEAQALAAELEGAAPAPLFQAVRVGEGKAACQAVALPGNDTLALGGNSLVETDLVVPVRGAVELRLSRHFHSFFRPGGALGPAWTLDLPRLEPVRRAEVVGTKKLVRTFYQLTSPLESVGAIFRRTGKIPQVKGEVLLADGAPDLLALVSVKDDELGPALLLLFQDGRRWYFNDAGELIARKEAPLTVRYHRDKRGRLSQIAATCGSRRASIDLDYDDSGRLRRARGSNGAEATYSYAGDGLLAQVDGKPGGVSYEYKDGLVSEVRRGKLVRRFFYDVGGRLLEESSDGQKVVYRSEPGRNAVRAVAVGVDGKEGKAEAVEYDPSYRPLRRTLVNGTRQEWKYRQGAVEVTTTLPDGRRYSLARSADGRRETWRLPEGGEVAVQRDGAGRVAAVLAGDRPMLRQEWHPNGLLRKAVKESVALEPDYTADGMLRGLTLTPPGARPDDRRWLRLELDAQGRPAGVTDSTGAKVGVAYDESGAPREWNTGRGKVTVERRAVEHRPGESVRVFNTSWGYREESIFATKGGQVLRTNITTEKSTASVEYDAGRLAKVHHFDGGVTAIAWHGEGAAKDRPRSVLTPARLALGFTYDAGGRVVEARCGAAHRWQYRRDGKGRLIGLTLLPGEK